MKIADKTKKCEYEDCKWTQDTTVYHRRSDTVLAVCHDCQDRILDETMPEYTQHCPNCGCGIPVN